MTALGIYLGIVLVGFLAYISVLVVKEDYAYFAVCLWIIAIVSVAFGMCIENVGWVPASDYLKSPESYQVDTFMVNGVFDHYQVSNK